MKAILHPVIFSIQVTHSTNMSNKWTADGAQPDVVSYWYFVASVAVWFLTPLVFMLVDLWQDVSLGILRGIRGFIGSLESHPIIRYPFMAVASYIASFLCVYLTIPFLDLYLGLRNVFRHTSYKSEGDDDEHDKFVAAKLPEQLGEAIPQFVIAMVFYSKNYYWLSSWEMIKGGVTMTLSCGSILVGIARGCKQLWAAHAHPTRDATCNFRHLYF